VADLRNWLGRSTGLADGRLLLSLRAQTRPLRDAAGDGSVLFLGGPEGGFTEAEEDAALAAGFRPVTLGPRVLRAETAALAALAALG
jgi:16S rRNA (uracil1498-N3)-methyltransferase